MLFMNSKTGELTESKAEARRWRRYGYNLLILNEWGYKMGVWYWDKSKPEFYKGFAHRILEVV